MSWVAMSSYFCIMESGHSFIMSIMSHGCVCFPNETEHLFSPLGTECSLELFVKFGSRGCNSQEATYSGEVFPDTVAVHVHHVHVAAQVGLEASAAVVHVADDGFGVELPGIISSSSKRFP